MATGSLLLLAGPNGAGKTTLLRRLREKPGLTPYVALNADDRTLKKIKDAGMEGFADTSMDGSLLKRLFIEAANEVYQEAIELLHAGHSVCLETVLSTDKFCPMVTEIINSGGRFELIYLALCSPEVSRERVSIRVRKDGHDVPVDRLKERWQRSLSFLPWFASRASEVVIFDNSGAEPLLVAKGGNGRLIWRVPPETVFPELRLALQAEFPELSET
jgi:predicted ABC-type ATPase